MQEKVGRNSFYHWAQHVRTGKEQVQADGEVRRIRYLLKPVFDFISLPWGIDIYN